jgi:hypothetical protein
MTSKSYWTTKMNDATARRLDKLAEQGVQIDTETHAGRQQINYCYLEFITEEE